jgi:3-oxoacyl-[acyl-carrier protein] reductase
MDLGLQGKVALVAAASRGLGRAVARELALEGAALVICSRKAESIDQAANEIATETGAEILALPCDVSQPAEVARLVQSGIERFGRIDILVTNSGGPPAGPFESFTLDQWEAATRLLLHSSVELARNVLPGMKERRWGRILNITSIAVKQPVDNLILSNSLRAAVTGMARTLANEVAALGITVNNIMPGYTRTERVAELARMMAKKEGIAAAEFIARWEEEIPMRRLGEPREFAALAAFLVSERAGYITGTSIPVDGGWVRGVL